MKRVPELHHVHGQRHSSQLSRRTWPAFDRLFSENNGVWGGCWCMYYHSPPNWSTSAYAKNRLDKRGLVRNGAAHGTLVFCGKDPVGWCQFGPRKELPRIDLKKGYSPTSEDAWRITCLFISKGHRRMGFADLAVRDSVAAMRKLHVNSVEAYPVEGKAFFHTALERYP